MCLATHIVIINVLRNGGYVFAVYQRRIAHLNDVRLGLRGGVRIGLGRDRRRVIVGRTADLHTLSASGRRVAVCRHADLRDHSRRFHAAAGICPVKWDRGRRGRCEPPNAHATRRACVNGRTKRENDLLQRFSFRAVRDIASYGLVFQRRVEVQREVRAENRGYQLLRVFAAVDRRREGLVVQNAERVLAGYIIEPFARPGRDFDVKDAD